MQGLFDKSKSTIIDLIIEGISIFDKSRSTCLQTDWCKDGIGFWLWQKHCDCHKMTPICCPTGWKAVFANGRFTNPAESRYAPIEGEALAVVFGLEKAKHFVLGCNDLIVATDHEPLLKVLGDRKLENIDNPRPSDSRLSISLARNTKHQTPLPDIPQEQGILINFS